jgi:hypothetical protein
VEATFGSRETKSSPPSHRPLPGGYAVGEFSAGLHGGESGFDGQPVGDDPFGVEKGADGASDVRRGEAIVAVQYGHELAEAGNGDGDQRRLCEDLVGTDEHG